MTHVGHAPRERHERPRAIGDPQRPQGPGLDAVLGGSLCELGSTSSRARRGRERQRSCNRFCSPTRPLHGRLSISRSSASRRSRWGLPVAVRLLRFVSRARGGAVHKPGRRGNGGNYAVFQRVATEVAAVQPSFIAVDSFRTIVGEHQSPASGGVIEVPRASSIASRSSSRRGRSLVSDRRIRGHRAAPPGLHGGRHDSLAVRGRRSQFGDAQAARGQGSRTRPMPGCTAFGSPTPACRCFRAFLSNSVNAWFGGTCAWRPECRGSTE